MGGGRYLFSNRVVDSVISPAQGDVTTVPPSKVNEQGLVTLTVRMLNLNTDYPLTLSLP